jgi:hypothetical protein
LVLILIWAGTCPRRSCGRWWTGTGRCGRERSSGGRYGLVDAWLRCLLLAVSDDQNRSKELSLCNRYLAAVVVWRRNGGNRMIHVLQSDARPLPRP